MEDSYIDLNHLHVDYIILLHCKHFCGFACAQGHEVVYSLVCG